MFSLILTIISIALTASMALATLYYGGSSFKDGSAKAEAARLHNQGQQILYAAELFQSELKRWPDDVEELVALRFLTALPLPVARLEGAVPPGVVGNASASTTARKWITPVKGLPVYEVLGVGAAACAKVNLMTLKVDGAYSKLVLTSPSQCYGRTLAALNMVVAKDGAALALAVPADDVLPGELPGPADAGWTIEPKNALVDAAPAPKVSLSRSQVAFGASPLSQTRTQQIVLTNSGTALLEFSMPPSISGDAAFTLLSSTCGSSLAPKERCTMSVSFTPTSLAGVSAALTYQTNAFAGVRSLPLTGSGASTLFKVSASRVDFDAATLNTPTTHQVVFTNTGRDELLFTVSPGVTGDASFVLSSTSCGQSLAAGDECYADVTFTPTLAPQVTGGLVFQTSVESSPSTIALSGSGLASLLELSYPQLDFGAGLVGVKTTQQLLVKNQGNVSLNFSPPPTLSGSASFELDSSACPDTLAAGAQCALELSFLPTAVDAVEAYLTVGTDDGQSQTSVLTGWGLLGMLQLSPTYFDFPAHPVNTVVKEVIWLSNTGNGPLTFVQAPAFVGGGSSAFSITNTSCLAVLGAGAECSVEVAFTPDLIDSVYASLAIVTGAGDEQLVSLSGSGLLGALQLSASSLDFAPQNVRTTTVSQLTVYNTGNGTVLFADNLALANGSDAAFTLTANSCVGALDSGASCYVDISFTPTSVDRVNASFTLNSSLSAAETVTLSGSGLRGELQVSTPLLGFGAVNLNTPATAAVTLMNMGTGPMSFTLPAGVSGSAAFALSATTCGDTLEAGAECSLEVTFTPDEVMPVAGALVFQTDEQLTPYSVELSGSGLFSLLQASTNLVDFGPTTVNGTATRQLILQNLGNTSLSFNGAPYLSGSASFELSTTTCAETLAAGATCALTLSFTPTDPLLAESVVMLSTATGPDQQIGVSGSGLLGTLELSTTAYDFSAHPVNASVTQRIVLSNTGNGPLTFSQGPVFSEDSSASFAVSGTSCGTTLTAGANCFVEVAFTPLTADAVYSTMSVSVSGAAPQTVSLSGSGLVGELWVSTPSLDFAPQDINTTLTDLVVLYNNGNGVLAFTTAPALTAGSNAAFTVTATSCGATLAAGSDCFVEVSFTPTSVQAVSASLAIRTNRGQADPVPLSGSGLSGALELSDSALVFEPQGTDTLATKYLTLTNAGTGSLTFTQPASFAAGGSSAFVLAYNDCGPTLGSGGTCTIGIDLTPTAPGEVSASLTINSNIGGTRQVSLSGSGLPGELQLWTPSLDLYGVTIGSTPAQGDVTFYNAGPGSLSLSTAFSAGSSAAFTKGISTCSGKLPAGYTCTQSISFNPATPGELVAGLTVSGAPGGDRVVGLLGTGLAPRIGFEDSAGLAITTVAFPTTAVAGTGNSPSGLITLRNTGDGVLKLNAAITVPSPYLFSGANTCAKNKVLGPQETCTFKVIFKPTVNGGFTGPAYQLNVASNAYTADSLMLSGSSLYPTVAYTDVASPIAFGTVPRNGTSTPQTLTMQNTGTASLTFNSAITAVAPFKVTSTTCASSLAVGASCTVTVVFSPTLTARAYNTATYKLVYTFNSTVLPAAFLFTGTGGS